MAVLTGIDVLQRDDYTALRGQRVGLMTHPAAVDAQLRSTYQVLHDAEAVNLVALFGPEHGFSGTAADGERVSSGMDRLTGLPIYSLYGETYRPTAEMLADIDVLVCDIQDVGARFYTFIYTISYILEAAGEHGVPVMILDRPNPAGDAVAGLLLEPGFATFVGRYPMPVQHGMTVGELSQMMNQVWNPTPATLTVIPCAGYSRRMNWQETGLVFVPPSPAMPHLSTVAHYPGACLLEGTALSEGRGTALPFELVGASGIDRYALAAALNALALPGVRFREVQFTPALSKHRDVSCGGVQVHITDAARFQPIRTWLAAIMTIKRMFPAVFEWKITHFDRLIGTDKVRRQIDAGDDLEAITAGWESDQAAFLEQRKAYLLYD
jgi:uncharacterized protein YbbC (DUF1343 family)